MNSEPIAIIGIGCRLPGEVDSPDSFWSLLKDGRRTLGPLPPDRQRRWPVPLSPETVPLGGFLSGVDGFDAHFFRIAPREAQALDPQQRILLEVSWQTLEHAGIDPTQLAGSETGVFIGTFSHDYERLQGQAESGAGPYFLTGCSSATAAGRLSFFYDLRGPAVAVDTASSASLVAVHLACRSLQAGDCSLALVGGVNLILGPETYDCYRQAGMLSPDGRSTAFDAQANGYVRGEGCGLVLLQPLQAAQAAGRRVLAVLRGSAINQDGATAALTLPSQAAQEALIAKALASAGLDAKDVSYVEAHGSGTPVGDPIEGRALQGTYGQKRERPLWVGSVKSNLGHLEAAAGIAGLIKVTLALHQRYIPAHVRFEALRPELADSAIEIPQAGRAWPSSDGAPRRAGVSAFGIGGTNAHVILEEATPTDAAGSEPPDEADGLRVLPLSAADPQALRTLCARYAEMLGAGSSRFAEVCATAAHGRAHLPHRLALVAESAASAQAQLIEWSRDPMGSDMLCGQASPATRPRIAFLYTGSGSQYLGMGRQLMASRPVFREALEDCDAKLRPMLGLSLLEVIYSEDEAQLERPSILQPALFAIGHALTQLWRSLGVTPDLVLGHSNGEYGAACAAGVLSLPDALWLVARRGQLLEECPAGAMVAVRATEAQLLAALAPYAHQVSIGVKNGPDQLVLSGESAALTALLQTLPDVEGRPLKVARAYHSPLLDSMLPALEQAAARVRLLPPQVLYASATLGRLAEHELCSPHYFRMNTRDTVQFDGALQAACQTGVTHFIEIGATPNLLPLAQKAATHGTFLPSLRPQRPDERVLLRSAAKLHVDGYPLHFSALAPAGRRGPSELPNYPFSHRAYWLAESPVGRPSPQPGPRPAVAGEASAAPAYPPPSPSLPAELLALSPAERESRVQAHLTGWVRKTLGLPAFQVPEPERLLREQGLDSLMSHELSRSIDQALRITLPAGRILAHGSIRSLTAILLDRLGNSPAGLEESTSAALAEPSAPTAMATAGSDAPPIDFHGAAAEIPQIHAVVTEQRARSVCIDGRWVDDFASCNYLGLDLHPGVMDVVRPAIEKWGVHPSWTRAVASPEIYEELESELADFVRAPSVLVFPSVTLLHAGVLPVLAGFDGVLFKDLAAHRSIHEGCQLAQAGGAEFVEFRHNDVADLEARLRRYPYARTKIIAIDGVYSMSGAYPPLPQLAELARTYNATVYMDDAHGIGVIGERPSPAMPYGHGGNGVVNYFGLDYVRDRLIYVAGLSKSFSSYGAFVTCHDGAMKNRLRSASTFIFSGPSPVASLASALAGVRINRHEGEAWRQQLFRLVQRLVRGAKALGFEVENENSFPIVGVVIGKTPDVIAACKTLWRHGTLITPAIYPIVPMDRGLLRFSVTAANTEAEIDRALDALAEVRQSLGSTLATPPTATQGRLARDQILDRYRA